MLIIAWKESGSYGIQVVNVKMYEEMNKNTCDEVGCIIDFKENINDKKAGSKEKEEKS